MVRAKLFLLLFCCGLLSAVPGCQLVAPQTAYEPVVRNPFPQLSRVAIAPFFNQSDEPTLDGRAAAMAYFAELQATPGFEVVPVGVVEEAMIEHRIDLGGPGEARRLAEILEVDAVVVGAVTDYSPYYPPRCGLRVEWYTANPGYHEIPAGYGLPWNTPEEEYIPDSLVYQSQMALARSQMQALTPNVNQQVQPLPDPPTDANGDDQPKLQDATAQRMQSLADPFAPEGSVRQAQHQSLAVDDASGRVAPISNSTVATHADVSTGPTQTGRVINGSPADEYYMNAAGGFAPYHGPVLQHTQIYRANDPDFSEALRAYAFFQDDQRIAGWQSYLNRSDDFLRFCCHLHISEMLSARGGSRKTRVVWRWPESR